MTYRRDPMKLADLRAERAALVEKVRDLEASVSTLRGRVEGHRETIRRLEAERDGIKLAFEYLVGWLERHRCGGPVDEEH